LSGTRWGIYTDFGGALSKVIATGDLLNGKTVTNVEFGAFGFSQGQVAFIATLDDGSKGLMMSTLYLDRIIVSNTNDSGEGSLRQAILDVPARDIHTITFASSVTGTIILTSGELAITTDMTINGPGAKLLNVSGNDSSRVFNVAAPRATLCGLTISGGNADRGAGIYHSSGALLIDNCSVSVAGWAGAKIDSEQAMVRAFITMMVLWPSLTVPSPVIVSWPTALPLVAADFSSTRERWRFSVPRFRETLWRGFSCYRRRRRHLPGGGVLSLISSTVTANSTAPVVVAAAFTGPAAIPA